MAAHAEIGRHTYVTKKRGDLRLVKHRLNLHRELLAQARIFNKLPESTNKIENYKSLKNT